MIEDDFLSKYLPRFLPEDDQVELFSDLKQLAYSHEYNYNNFYYNFGKHKKQINQGDGINNLTFVNIPSMEDYQAPGIILSNTCDINLKNQRETPTKIVYAPIFKLENYIELLQSHNAYNEQHIEAIRNQQVTQIFYLPKGMELEYEGIVHLDHISSADNESIARDNLGNTRIFKLSLFGFYAFIIKITHHFSRVNKELIEERSSLNP